MKNDIQNDNSANEGKLNKYLFNKKQKIKHSNKLNKKKINLYDFFYKL